MPDYPFDEMVEKDVSSVEEFSGGINNPRYKVTCEDGKVFTVQIVGDKFPDKIEREKINVKIMKDRGLSVPDIVKADRSHEIIEKDYLVKEYLQGKTLSQVKKELTESEVRKIYQRLGDLYTKMHSMTFERFGKIVEIGGKFKVETSFDSYRDFFLDLSSSWLDRGVNTPFEDKVPELEEWLEKNSHIFKDYIEPRLVHSDFSSRNIIIHNSGVEGIIDFDIARAGNNVFDIYRVYRHFKEEKKSEVAVNGFFETYSTDLPQNYKKQIKFYRTINPLSYIDCWKQIEDSYSEKELEETESFVHESIQKILESSFL